MCEFFIPNPFEYKKWKILKEKYKIPDLKPIVNMNQIYIVSLPKKLNIKYTDRSNKKLFGYISKDDEKIAEFFYENEEWGLHYHYKFYF